MNQSRESVSWNEKRQQWRWTLVVDRGKTHTGWAATKAEALLEIERAPNPVIHQPRYRGPRTPWWGSASG